MKLACIDIGTNSIRLMIADFDGFHYTNVVKELEMTRLGFGVNETKQLDVTRMKRSADVIETYYKKSLISGAKHVFMMATSAVRDARNSHEFNQMIQAKTGQNIDIISGDLEAEVGFKGVQIGSGDSSKNLLIIDIGGGSTELIVGDSSGIKFSVSLNIGAVRLTGAYVKNDPVLLDEVIAMKNVIRQELDSVIDQINLFQTKSAIGIGGTATTIATMIHSIEQYSREKVHQLIVYRSELIQINDRLITLNNESRKTIIGLDEKRADIILAGSLILQEILEKLHLESYSVSDYDNLEGYTAYKYKQLNN